VSDLADLTIDIPIKNSYHDDMAGKRGLKFEWVFYHTKIGNT
jgi:hypothetical protein